MRDFLSQEERNKLRAQHKQERDKRVCDRIKAVLLADEGWTFQQIAKVLLLSDEAISQQVQDYLVSQKLKPANGGSISKLNAEQTKSLREPPQDLLDVLARRITDKFRVMGKASQL